MIIKGNNWRKLHGYENTYTLQIGKSRSRKADSTPRLNWDTEHHTLSIWYPTSAPGEIDAHLTRLYVSAELKKILHPKKYLTYIQEGNKFDNAYCYAVEYYAEIDEAPDDCLIQQIVEICKNPVLL